MTTVLTLHSAKKFGPPVDNLRERAETLNRIVAAANLSQHIYYAAS